MTDEELAHLEEECSECGGRGSSVHHEVRDAQGNCLKCGGKGNVFVLQGVREKCRNCFGQGKVGKSRLRCQVCYGRGTVPGKDMKDWVKAATDMGYTVAFLPHSNKVVLSGWYEGEAPDPFVSLIEAISRAVKHEHR